MFRNLYIIRALYDLFLIIFKHRIRKLNVWFVRLEKKK